MKNNKIVIMRTSFSGSGRKKTDKLDIIKKTVIISLAIIGLVWLMGFGMSRQTRRDCYTAIRHGQEFNMTPPDNLVGECKAIGIEINNY